jgi:hypothetical protein
MRVMNRVAGVLVVGALTVAVAACGGSAGATTVTVSHGPVAAPVLVDGGDAGPSAGDVRYFSFSATSDGGAAVHFDSVMTTTGIVEGSTDEYRDTRILVTFANPADQLILEGMGVYPGEGSTLRVESSVTRPIIGGSGKYPGATGDVVSTHNADGTWTHTFHLR